MRNVKKMSSEPTVVKDSPPKITLRRLETSKLTPSSLDDLMFHVVEVALETILRSIRHMDGSARMW